MKYFILPILTLFMGLCNANAQSIALDTTWVKRYGWVYKGGATNDLRLQFIYPKGEDSITQTIREDITKKFFETESVLPLEESCEQLLRYGLGNRLFEEGSTEKTYLHRYSAVKIINNKILDYIISHDISVGCGTGATTHCYCYDLSTGKQINIDDLFSKSAQSQIINMLQSRYDDYSESRQTNMHRVIEHLDNFILLPRGLIFVYNPYEIGAGYESEFRYTVKHSEIAHLLKPEAFRYFTNE